MNDELLIGLVSISDRASSGVYEDKGLPALQEWFGAALSSPWKMVTRLIPDEQPVIEKTLKEAGAGLKDLVTMTVFITDSRYGKQFTDIRLELFKDDFPASALITCDGLARPDMLVEVQGIAMI